MRILAADDDKVSLAILERQLAKWGHEVITAEDGSDAWNIVRERDVDMIVSDWMMPGISGVEFVRLVRSLDEKDYIYFILLTAKQSSDDVVEGLEAGADDFIAKPFVNEELRVRILSGQRILSLERNLRRQNTELAVLNRRMLDDLNNAAAIQQGLLPPKILETDKYTFHYSYQPCEQLAGDTLNIVPVDDRHVAFYLLDVSGHGVSAALLAFSLSRLLSPDPQKGILFRTDDGKPRLRTPRELVEHLNVLFPVEDPDTRYFSIIYAILDMEKDSLSYVAAGHPGIVQIDGHNSPVVFHATGPPVGISVDASWETRNLDLSPGSRFIVYSDGINETMGQGVETFGHERVRDVLLRHAESGLDHAVNALLRAVGAWRGTSAIRDDVSVVGLERKSSDNYIYRRRGRRLNMEFVSDLRLVSKAVEDVLYFINDKHVEISVFNLNLVLREALNNAVIHGNQYNTGKRVFLEVRLKTGELAINVTDEGDGFDWRNMNNDAGRHMRDHGMGLEIMSANGYKVEFNDTGNSIFLSKAVTFKENADSKHKRKGNRT